MCVGRAEEFTVNEGKPGPKGEDVMGGGEGGGMSSEQRYYQQHQLEIQKESLELSKQQLENAKNSVTEPVKSAESAMAGAADSTVRAAQLRRGIASTFNRGTAFSSTSGGTTSGTATKLGG